MQRPPPTLGLHHVALNVADLAACQHFYVDLLGMSIEWQPDEKNVYLTSGTDNLALHETVKPITGNQHLDHIGFIVDSPQTVDQWYTFLHSQNVPLKTAPQTHRDGAHSFYCQDPDGNLVQFIYHPPLVKK